MVVLKEQWLAIIYGHIIGKTNIWDVVMGKAFGFPVKLGGKVSKLNECLDEILQVFEISIFDFIQETFPKKIV